MIHGIINSGTKRTYLKSHKRCSHCNGKATTIDHIIPCQVFEMTSDYEDEFRDSIRDRSNWQPSCASCNKKRGARFIPALVSPILRERYHKNIDEYVKAREEVLKAQDGKCAKCGQPLKVEDAVLKYKKKASSNELNNENCIVICYNCEECKKTRGRSSGNETDSTT